ncbi:MAG: hypothetical protein QM765_29325 [Myxococcales bacterium]
MGARVLHRVPARRLVLGVEQAQDEVVQAQALELGLVHLRAGVERLHDEAVEAGQALGGEAGEPGGIGAAQQVGEVGLEAADGEAADLARVGVLEQAQERRRRALPSVRVSALVELLGHRPEAAVAPGIEQRLMAPDLAGDPRPGEGEALRVVAEQLDREVRVELGDGLAQQAQVAPDAPAQVEDGARANLVAVVGRGLEHVEAVAEHAEHLRVVALLGELVDLLGGLPDAPAHAGREEDGGERGAGGLVTVLVERDQQLAQEETRRRVGCGEQRLPSLAARGLALGAVERLELVLGDRLLQAGQRPLVGRERRGTFGWGGCGRELGSAGLGVVLLEVLDDERSELGVPRPARVLEVGEQQLPVGHRSSQSQNRACRVTHNGRGLLNPKCATRRVVPGLRAGGIPATRSAEARPRVCGSCSCQPHRRDTFAIPSHPKQPSIARRRLALEKEAEKERKQHSRAAEAKCLIFLERDPVTL